MKKTNKQNTFNALDSNFLNTQNMKLNEGYLKESIELNIFNNRELYNQVKNNRIKPHSVVWQAFLYTANSCLDFEEYNTQATSEQLKAYLNQYGYDYKTFFNDLIEVVEEDRKERKDFQEKTL